MKPQQLVNTLKKLMPPQDKLQHLFVGLLLTPLFIVLNTYFTIGVISIIAFGYEVFQKITKTGQFDIWDAVFVIIPSIITLIILILI